jgi:hypothetical protein
MYVVNKSVSDWYGMIPWYDYGMVWYDYGMGMVWYNYGMVQLWMVWPWYGMTMVLFHSYGMTLPMGWNNI